MNFEIGKTIDATLWNGVNCKLNYTPEFIEYDEWVEGQFYDLEDFETGILTSLDAIAKKDNLTGDIVATAFISEDDSYLHLDVNDMVYMLSVLPVGTNDKYRLAAIAEIY